MKTLLIAAIALVAGTAFGIVQTRFDLRYIEPAPAPSDNVAQSKLQPKAEVLDELTHEFGSMNRYTEMQKVWRIKNVGNDALTLTVGSVTCSLCVQCEIDTPSVAPGETGTVKVTWSPKVYKPDFRHGVEIRTNDPDQPAVRIQIRGSVTENVAVEPHELSFTALSSDANTSLKFRIYGYERDDLKVEFSGLKQADTSDYFDVSLEPLPPQELEDHVGAKCGYEGTVVVKPGLPVGSVTQTIQLSTNDEKLTAFEVSIRGVISSDISLIGRGADFRRDSNLLTLGPVKRVDGAKAELSILVRGEQRDNVQLSVGETDPQQALIASIGEPNRLESVTMYPLTIEVPAGCPSVSRMGPGRTNLGRVVINTTHPDAKQVLLLVRFAVEE